MSETKKQKQIWDESTEPKSEVSLNFRNLNCNRSSASKSKYFMFQFSVLTKIASTKTRSLKKTRISRFERRKTQMWYGKVAKFICNFNRRFSIGDVCHQLDYFTIWPLGACKACFDAAHIDQKIDQMAQIH